jgi:hypothetical protein
VNNFGSEAADRQLEFTTIKQVSWSSHHDRLAIISGHAETEELLEVRHGFHLRAGAGAGAVLV